MSLKNIFFLVIASLMIFPVSRAQAAMSPLALSIVPPVQFPPADWDVVGLRASVLWGKHRAVTGIDLGLVGNITTNEFTGLAVAGGFNMTEQHATIIGLQAAGITNLNMEKTTVVGLQLAGLANYNKAESSIFGVGLAVANITPNTNVYGIQAGLYNHARSVSGFQIGIFNQTEDLHGLQIGLINMFEHGLFKIAPILNIGF